MYGVKHQIKKKQHINAGKCNQRAITPIQMTCFSCN